MKELSVAQVIRDRQRSESEARDIIHDIDRLNTIPEHEKTRWVWELLQNAKDVATENGVDVTYKLSGDEMIFSHNGLSFETKHLIAILYKTSTKSLGGDDGTTGKYGTGFVTTHILSKKLTISGIHEDNNGKRHFTLEIDRTAALLDEKIALSAMQKSLTDTFSKIDSISEKPSEKVSEIMHSFTYPLSEFSKKYAELGLHELEHNIIFTLLINRNEKKKINSVTIDNNGTIKTFTIKPEPSRIEGLKYVKTEKNEGILYKENGGLIFGLPVLDLQDKYEIKGIENKSVLFKEFPLIGTEGFNLPVLIQHNKFKPTEKRDGIRTKKERQDIEDTSADTNRNCLLEFVQEYIYFQNVLIDDKASGLYNLSLSGLPEKVNEYSNIEWIIENVQVPIRENLIAKEIVETVSGKLISIPEAIFPAAKHLDDEDFYEILSSLQPDRIPSKDGLQFWNKTIHQELGSWPHNVTIDIEKLLEILSTIVNLEKDETYQVLIKLYTYLSIHNSSLGETNPIYLNEKNEFKINSEVFIYPEIDDEIKFVSKELGRDLDIEFLNKKLGLVTSIKPFQLTEFYKCLNAELISSLQLEKATASEINAVLYINSLFRSDRAPKRDEWLSIIRELLPEKLSDKKIILIDYDNFHYPAELWTAKYICSLIQQEKNITQFSQTYFQGNLESAYLWLNKFLDYITQSREDIKGFLTRYNIIPVQNEDFVSYSETIFKESNPYYFDESLKIIVKDYCQIDSGKFLIKNEITNESFRTRDVEIITKPIDKLFEDSNIQSKVAKGGELYDVFLTVNSWFEKHIDASSYLKTFASKRDMLYVISLGEGFSKQIMALKESGKSMEDIVELAKIKLTTTEMKQLEKVANELGTQEIIRKAEEMIYLKNQRIKWKEIGDSAENAFKQVFSNLEMEIDLNNPDVGKDFEILLKSKGFSIEIKNVIIEKPNVRMSILQGRTAVLEKDKYALCVLTRPDDETQIDEEYFKQNAQFVTNIGYQIGDKINDWDKGLIELSLQSDIKVNLDSKTETVYINRNIWKNGISFSEFIEYLNKYFESEL